MNNNIIEVMLKHGISLDKIAGMQSKALKIEKKLAKLQGKIKIKQDKKLMKTVQGRMGKIRARNIRGRNSRVGLTTANPMPLRSVSTKNPIEKSMVIDRLKEKVNVPTEKPMGFLHRQFNRMNEKILGLS